MEEYRKWQPNKKELVNFLQDEHDSSDSKSMEGSCYPNYNQFRTIMHLRQLVQGEFKFSNFKQGGELPTDNESRGSFLPSAMVDSRGDKVS